MGLSIGAKYDSMGFYVPMNMLTALKHLLKVLFVLLMDVLRLLFLTLRSGMELRAENLFLRKQLAFYAERKIEPRRVDDEARIIFILLSKFFGWKDALVLVKPDTLIGPSVICCCYAAIFCSLTLPKSTFT
jgi:hypothetical protein